MHQADVVATGARWLVAAIAVMALAGQVQSAAAEQPAAAPPSPTPEQRIATLKQWLQASQQQIRAYEWVETTTTYLKGEEKSRQQKLVYYGVDGALQKVDQGGGQQKGPSGPLRKRIAANKQEELTDYMQSAMAVIQSYVPPSPSRIQGAIDAGKLAVSPAGQRVNLNFRDYLKPGDTLGVSIEAPTSRLLGVNVSSYLESPADPVSLEARMGVLPDGTVFTERTTLEAPARDLTIVIENTGHRRN